MPLTALLIRRCAAGFVLLACLISASSGSQAQESNLPRCSQRATVISDEINVDMHRWCLESVIHDLSLEALSFTALAVDPDGALYATRPLNGEVMVIRDSDGDQLPDLMETFADGLTLPNGLAYYAGALYVAGGAHIYRIAAAGVVETLVDDLPVGAGFPSGGITIGADQRLYVATGAPCSLCEYSDAERGAILSLRLDGSDRRVVASGFRRPADVAFFRGQLWTLDSAPPQTSRNALDELNRVREGGWYGFPYCLGAGSAGIASERADCDESIAPVMLFGSGAAPSSLASYTHDLLPGAADTLIVVLRGDSNQVDMVGYKVIMVTFDAADAPLGATVLVPFRFQFGHQAFLPYTADGLYWEKFIHINELGIGIFPQQPLAVAVSPQGWIYISITGGRIVALRPRYGDWDEDTLYPVWTPMNPSFDPSAIPRSTGG